MKKIIIFGCGYIGKVAYEKLKSYYEIIAWCDNDDKLHGKKLKDIIVIKPSDIKDLMKKENLEIFVAMLQTKDVVEQLMQMGYTNINVWKGGFFYTAKGLFPIEFPNIQPHKKKNDVHMHILFISDVAAIRDNKMAYIARMNGNKVYHAYMVESPNSACPEYEHIYEEIFPIMSIKQLIDFVRESDFDVIHCSSEPEYTTPLLLGTGKRIIHDCHDLRSSNQVLSPDQLLLEYLAYSGASGTIYPSEHLRDEVINKYNIPKEKTLVIENFPSGFFKPQKRLPKLSAQDGMIHCVYEGRITYGNPWCKRFYEKMWLKIAESGIHIHFYSQCKPEYCKYLESLHKNLHYEGNLSSNELADELSKYDVGLCLFNVNKETQLYLEATSPIKLYEYINAGIPVAVGNVKAHIDIVKENKFGNYVNLEQDIYSQMKDIADMKIPKDILKEKGFLFECMKNKLIDFYKSV